MIYSLFIGRWQPPHQGHKQLIEIVLKEGKSVLIAIRDTGINEKNPYSYKERKKIFRRLLNGWQDQVEIIKIPDIEEICYGRKVGWGIREIKLDEETEKISATKIRQGGGQKAID